MEGLSNADASLSRPLLSSVMLTTSAVDGVKLLDGGCSRSPVSHVDLPLTSSAMRTSSAAADDDGLLFSFQNVWFLICPGSLVKLLLPYITYNKVVCEKVQ